MVCHIKSGDISLVEHFYIHASPNCCEIVYDVLPMYSDNRADTHFFGANFSPIIYNRKQFNVSPFSPEYSE